MKKIITSIFVSVLLLSGFTSHAQLDRSKIPGPGPAPVIRLGKYESFTLKNGLKVFVVRNTKLPRVAFSLTLDYDPILEKEYAGYVNIAGEMMRTGTKTRSKDQLDEEIDFIGASLSTSATGIYAASLKKHQDKLLTLVADVLLNPEFKQAELDKLKTQTKSGIASQKDDPNAVAALVSNVVLYGKNHPYGEPTTEETVEKITLDKVKSFYNTYYKPNISYLAIVGDITLAEAKQVTEKYFGKWQSGKVPVATHSLAGNPAKTNVTFVDRSTSVQSVVTITHTIPLKPGSPDAIAARVTNDILGGQGGRLFNNLREKRGFTYGAYSSIQPDKVIGEFSASASVRNAVTDSAVTEFLNELQAIKKDKVTQEELSKTKNSVTGSFVRSLESPQTIASFAINTARYQLPADYYANYLKKVAAVKPEDVQAIAQKYIHPDHAHIVVVGNKAEVAEKLKPFGEIGYYDTQGNQVQATTQKTISAGLTAEEVISKYIKAIGGKEKLAALKDVQNVLTATVQGMPISINQQLKAPDKFLQTITVQGSEFQKMIVNGAKASMVQQGQPIPLEGKLLEILKVQVAVNPELKYAQIGVKTKLIGIEAINGQDAYKVELTLPQDAKLTDYYAVESGLKVRQTYIIESPQGNMLQTMDFADYKEVGGVKFPYTIVQTVGPQIIDMKAQSVEVNKGIADEVFVIK